MCTLGKIFPLLLALLLPCAVRADSAALEQAEKLFQSGEWEKARQAYAAELVAHPDPSQLPAAFFYNYGTILAKAGAPSEAYIVILRAAFAQPFDGDIRANLALAEHGTSAAALAVKPALWLQWWPASWRFVPWPAWLCLALLLTIPALALPRGKFRLPKIWLATLGASLILLGGLGYSQSYLPVSGLLKAAKVRSGPGASFPEITSLEPGSLMNVDGNRDGWLKVRFTRGSSAEIVGWIEPAVALEVK